MTTLTYIVDADDEGVRLDRWFKRHRPDVAHTLLSMWTRKGLVRVDGAKADVSDRLAEGAEISVPPITEAVAKPVKTRQVRSFTADEQAEIEAMVIHKDAHALVLNKPPGLATQGGTKTPRHVDGMLDALMFERTDRPKLVHRLDKDTSGVLLVARTPRAAAWFSKAFASRDARKVYWALVMGVPRHDDGLIDAPLAKQPGTGGEKMHVDEANGLPAKTFYRVIERAGNRAAWVELLPHTGRTHQLRVHMAAIGHPIVGDLKYGGKDAMLTGGVSRKMHLHARSLRVDHPDRKSFEISAALPTHMRESWAMLGFEENRAQELADERKYMNELAAAAPKPKAKPDREKRSERRTRAPAKKSGWAKAKPRAKPRGKR
jgi:23S rRNA pseudouridine955/2504/2580 synthase